jgi:hypothetical protein
MVGLEKHVESFLVLNMNNATADTLIEECKNDLNRIERIIEVLTSTNPAVPFLTRYAIIKTCGTLEQCFKIIISDCCILNQNAQVTKYIDITFRESSMNPNLDNIFKSLSKFDDTWHRDFKQALNAHADKVRIKQSIASLNNARNEFAHGGNPTTTFSDVRRYFDDAEILTTILDEVVR